MIPLFGGAAPARPVDRLDESDRLPDAADAHSASAALGRLRQVEQDDTGDDRYGGAAPDADGAEWHPTWVSDRPARGDDDPAAPAADLAEKALLKKLRTRSLSISEARSFLREYELGDGAAEDVLASLQEYGYLDDAALAEQLVHAGADRKGQGRQAIAQTLAKRGIPRALADAALETLPDDDLERALEFARSKARSMRSLDRDTALRRLSGQLARRGYGGSLAMTAARIALDESPGGSTGVRFH